MRHGIEFVGFPSRECKGLSFERLKLGLRLRLRLRSRDGERENRETETERGKQE